MKLPYPQSIPCVFNNFPVALDIRMGPSAGDIVAGASLGSKFTLMRTPKCGVPQGDYVVGSALPDCRMIYSDTGNDDDFTIKASFIGYGTFYKYTSSDEFLRFQVYKAIAIETSMIGELVFGDIFDCETLIPATQDVEALFNYESPSIQYTEQTTSGSDTNGGYVWINGTKYYIPSGMSIDFIGSSSGKHTVSIVNNTVVIS
ncbi:hypothetical protein K9F62_03025 [Desulfovibrio sp. JY]|nr:hypothetical protein K9F62_03025 [Desulfovibrio sp. JY]